LDEWLTTHLFASAQADQFRYLTMRRSDNRLEITDGSNLLGAISDAGTVGNLYISGGISTFDSTVTAGYGEFTGLCLGNGTNCITSWSGAQSVSGSGTTGAVAYWVDASTLGSFPQLPTSMGGTGIDTSALSGVPYLLNGTWATTGVASQGDILYFNGTEWTELAAGTAGYYLQTQGAGANPRWFEATGGSSDWTQNRRNA
jgi:hypothetical protein